MIVASLLAALTLGGCAAPGPALDAPGRAIYTSQRAADGLDARLQRLTASAGASHVRITEEELNSYLDARLTGAPLRETRVWFTRGWVYVSARLLVLGDHRLESWLELSQEQGQLRARLSGARLDGRPLPAFAVFSLRAAVNAALADARWPVLVERIVLGEGSLSLLVNVVP